MKTYAANVTRDGKWWMVAVPEIDGLTQARSLAEADRMARSLIAVTLDVAQSTFDIDLTVQSVASVADVTAEVEAIAALREQAAREERAATAKAVRLAKELASNGITVRDIGAMLGITFQRAHQLVAV
jgi:predicted RNase H-like HicB family nuclease